MSQFIQDYWGFIILIVASSIASFAIWSIVDSIRNGDS